MNGALWWLLAKAFLTAFVLTPIIRDISRAYNVVDRPGRRKVHRYPIPRVGGISIAAAFLIGLPPFPGLYDIAPDYMTPVWQILPGAAVTFAVGLVDDFISLRPVVKLAGQVLGASVIYFGGLRVEAIAGFVVPEWLSLALTVLWLILTSNALNLIDGLDGLCTGLGSAATLAFLALALVGGNDALAIVTLPLAGALVGFLCFNFNPATVFLGDSGALLIGFLLGCYSLLWTGQHVTPAGLAIVVLTLAVPLLDVALSIVRRFLKGQRIFSADRGHIHHRLLDRGLSARRAVLVLYLVAAVAGVFAVLIAHPSLSGWHPLLLAVFAGILCVFIQQLRYAEFDVLARYLFGGELRRSIAIQSRIEYLAAALEASHSEEEWWSLLVALARDIGCVRIRWTGHHPGRDEVIGEGAQAAVWSLAVPLDGGESICLDGGAQPGLPPLDATGLARAIHQSLAARRSTWEQPILP